MPYVLSRVFRPTFLEVFNITNLELGSLFSIYGFVAFFSYVYGGILADKISTRVLLSISLILTSFGGFVIMTYPSYLIMQFTYAYWGFTTVFIFWAPMIKATKILGGLKKQGKTFSFLDGGRGVVASSIAILGVIIFSLLITDDISKSTTEIKQNAFKYVIGISSFIVFLNGLIVYFFLKVKISDNEKIGNFSNIKNILKSKSIYLISIIILCSYMGYKITDIYSLYAKDVMMYDEINASRVGAFQLYLRPIVCLIIALFTDRIGNINNISIGFVIMLIGSILFSSGIINSSLNTLFIFSLIIVAIGTYATRALYFSIIKDTNIKAGLSGTAIGIVSMIGFTPDMFATPFYGYLLDTFPGVKGHQFIYIILGVFSIIGLYTTIKFKKITR